MKLVLSLFLVIHTTLLYSQTVEVDSLRILIDSHKEQDTVLVNLKTRFAHLLIRNRNLEEGKKQAEEATQIASRIGFENGRINGLNALAAVYTEKGQYSEAIAIYYECIAYCQAKKNVKGEMNAYNSIGLTYYNSGNYKESLSFHYKALKLAEQENIKSSIAKYHNNISRIYYVFNDYEKAIFYAEKSIEIEKSIGPSPENLIYRAINLSNYYNESGKPEKSIILLSEMINLNDSLLKNATLNAYMSNNLGQAYFKQSILDKSVEYYQIAYDFFKSIDDSANFSVLGINMAHCEVLLGNSKKALSYLGESFLFTPPELLEMEQKRYAYEIAILVYKKMSNYPLAFHYSELLRTLKDSIYQTDQLMAIAEMQTKYETKQKQDSILNQQKWIQQQTKLNTEIEAGSRYKTMLLFFMVAIILILLVVGILNYVQYKKKQKLNQILLAQNEMIELKNKENEILLAEIHHRVKNNLQVISSLLSLQGKSIEDKTARIAIESGKQRIKSMELVHKMLYESSTYSFIEMKEFTEKLVQNLSDVFGIEKKNFLFNYSSPPLNLDIDTAVPLALILNELVVNVFKYANTDQLKLIISIEIADDLLVMKIIDNGPGTDEKSLLTSDSFGLKLVKLLTKQLAGTMDLKNENGLQYIFRLKEFKRVTL